MYVDTNNKTEYFIYIVTILRIVRSESQTSIHILGYPYFILSIMGKFFLIVNQKIHFFAYFYI